MEKSHKNKGSKVNHPYGEHTIAEVKSYIQNLLETNDYAVTRALAVIFDRQTADEQVTNTTSDANSVGFSGVHAEICSSFAKQYKSRGFLSSKQMVIARRIMKKYWKQLAEIAVQNGKLPKVLPPAMKVSKVTKTENALADTSANQRKFNLATY